MTKYLRATLLLLIVECSFVSAQTDSKIASIIAQVNIDSLYENLKELTGEKQVTLPSWTGRITSRAYGAFGNLAAEEYLQLRLKKYGLETSLQIFDGGGGNIIGIQKGVSKPNQKIIICAHFDCRPYSDFAPGADDNGSGTSAVLEAARILSRYKTDYTIVYALWDNEELGLQGSYYYAQKAVSQKDSIIAVINMDMIGWDSNNDYLAEIHTRDVSRSNQLASNLIKINADYGVGLQLAVVNPGTSSSDHSSFWNGNYSAILLIENLMNDKNIYYHQNLDGCQFINKTFFEKCAKASIGTLAFYAGIQTLSSVEEMLPESFNLAQNYPNPFNPSTKIKYSIAKESHVKLIIYDALGKEIIKLVDQIQSPNNYELEFNTGGNFSSGTYFYALYGGDTVIVRKMLLIK